MSSHQAIAPEKSFMISSQPLILVSIVYRGIWAANFASELPERADMKCKQTHLLEICKSNDQKLSVILSLQPQPIVLVELRHPHIHHDRKWKPMWNL
jgi:hypothetical protein